MRLRSSDASHQQIADARCCSNYGWLDASAVVIKCVYLQTRVCSRNNGYRWSGAYDCKCVRAAATTVGQVCTDSRGAAAITDTQTRMTADVFVLLDCGWCEWLQTRVCCRSYEHSDTYDCRRVHRVVIVEVLPQLRTHRRV